jgi:hypothetical protein
MHLIMQALENNLVFSPCKSAEADDTLNAIFTIERA